MKKRSARARKPANIILVDDTVAIESTDSQYAGKWFFNCSANYYTLSDAKQLHAWLGRAIKWMEGR